MNNNNSKERLGLRVCEPHACPCGDSVDAFGVHAFACKKASGRFTRHNAVNDIITRAVAAGDFPVTKEPAGLIPGTVKRPDGVTLLPWRTGDYLAWDVTVSATLAASFLGASSTLSGSASEVAATKKIGKYSGLPSHYSFQPVSFENLGASSASTARFIDDLGRLASRKSGDPRESVFLWQRLSVALQRFNSVLLAQSFIPIQMYLTSSFLFLFFYFNHTLGREPRVPKKKNS